MVLEKILPVKERPLKLVDLPVPTPGSKQILVKVSAWEYNRDTYFNK